MVVQPLPQGPLVCAAVPAGAYHTASCPIGHWEWWIVAVAEGQAPIQPQLIEGFHIGRLQLMYCVLVPGHICGHWRPWVAIIVPATLVRVRNSGLADWVLKGGPARIHTGWERHGAAQAPNCGAVG